ncbi:Methyltransferase-like protein 24 [Rhizophlyctis rosea]|uniref:Methyltransferase-like protein 24 n=1 Tax=Rhizophlyctis rosea TaxID=64517 RepID=A0AAD5SFJ3_9FUNG|nr:Methyltransferase-like protein 24 [Rhizophlyctis rosea]
MLTTQKLKSHIATRKCRIIVLLLTALFGVTLLHLTGRTPLRTTDSASSQPVEEYQSRVVHQAVEEEVEVVAPCDWAKDDHSDECQQASRKGLVGMGVDIRKLGKGKARYEVCGFKKVGTGWGAHDLCERPPSPSEICVFYSFGIDKDYSFDTTLDNDWHCHGVLLDPTISHSSSLGPRLTFFKVGATLLDAKDLGGAGADMRGTTAEGWYVTSVPSLKKFLKHDKIKILKMDCEGCEYALPRDIAHEDPTFFSYLDQFAVEIHVSKAWIKTPEHVHYLGLLFHMLTANNLRLMDAKMTACGPQNEKPG